MQFIDNLKNIIKKEVDTNLSVKILTTLGYIDERKPEYFNSNISKKNLNKIKNLLKRYNVNNNFESEHYFYKDLELINCNDESICIQNKETKIIKFINKNINNNSKNYGSMKIKFINKLIKNNIYFPSFIDYIEYNNKKNSIYISKYRNSDIKIIFEEIINYDSYRINFLFSCDKSNYDNIIKNFVFILKIIFYNNINFKKTLF